jgi:hypothetical protein
MSGNDSDIKCPDGYLIGGMRKVRADGSILFQRCYWQAPKEWVGLYIWVHAATDSFDFIDGAPPGYGIYESILNRTSIELLLIDRPGAKPGYRLAWKKAWINRDKSAAQ